MAQEERGHVHARHMFLLAQKYYPAMLDASEAAKLEVLCPDLKRHAMQALSNLADIAAITSNGKRLSKRQD